MIATIAMSGLMLFSTFFFFDLAWIFIPFFILLSYITTYFAIAEGVDEVEWLMLFAMPIAFTISSYLFYYLFPVRWLTRIPFISIYGVSMYAILLTSNIFNVGVERNLQLYRAAFSVNYFYQTMIAFLSFNTLASFKESFVVNGIVAAGITYVLALQFLWSIKLDLRLDKQIAVYAFLIALVLGQGAVIFSFMPYVPSVFALVLTAAYYSLAGLVYSHLDLRLFRETVREYVAVLAIVFVIGILSLSW